MVSMTTGTASTDQQLAGFLRSRRAAADVEALAPMWHGSRRVPGLRREELADLAGLSLTYYTRLEQGLATNPSSQVLDALARALRFSQDERAHLYRLAGAQEPVQPATATRIHGDIVTLLDRMTDVPAIALSPLQDILAWNRLGHAVLAANLPADAPDGVHPPNKVELLFTDPASRTLYREWELEAELAVASLRYVSASPAGNSELAALVGRLSVASDDFARLWAEQPVQLCTSGIKRFHHPVVGRMDLGFQILHLPENDGHRLLVLHPKPGSSDDAALRVLASATIS